MSVELVLPKGDISEFDALISIKPRFVDLILSGVKTVELRRRAPQIPENTTIWIYSTVPIAKVLAFATVGAVYEGPKGAIWERFSESMAISRSEFEKYLSGSERASAIQLKKVQKIEDPVALSHIKSQVSNFHPPQFFQKIFSDDPLLELISSGLDCQLA
ncbi:MAG: ASCH domain-containing protein [Alphaproteobacteria bacterium]